MSAVILPAVVASGSIAMSMWANGCEEVSDERVAALC